jgi:hypothetical protein
VLGVDESDLVKYDGQHLYIASNPPQFYAYTMAWSATASSGDIPVDEITALDEAKPSDGETDGFAPDIIPVETWSAKIRVLQTTTGDAPSASEVAVIELDDKQGQIAGLYLKSGDATAGTTSTLAVLSNDQSFGWSSWNQYYAWSNGTTHLTLFDVSNPAASQKLKSLELDGSLIDSRRIDNKLYLVTRYVPNVPALNWFAADIESIEQNSQTIDDLTLDDLLPKQSDQSGVTQNLVNAENCFVPESAISDYYSPELVTLSTIDLNNPETLTSVCVAGYTSGVFASTDALYLFNDQWNQGTIIHKFAFSEQGTAYKGSGTIPGSLGWRSPAFRLSEKDGALIAVSTEFPESSLIDPIEPVMMTDIAIDADESTKPDEAISEREPVFPTHKLTVLVEGENNELKTVWTIPNEAQPAAIGKPNEDIYAVRYSGNRGYIVTYQRTDPLYVVDLTDVTKASITGELHVEGYSDYLHPIGEQYLIGVGKSSVIADNTAWIQGVQVGLFDVGNLSAPQLVQQIEIGGRGSETELSYNHKAFGFMAMDANSYRMTLPVSVNGTTQTHPSDWAEWQYTGLHLFDINTEGTASISAAGKIVAEQSSAEQPYSNYVQTQRGIMHNDSVHYVYGDKVFSANWNNPAETTTKAQ